jgi:Glucodextranase, domain N
MTSPSFPRLAPDGPGFEPRWTRGAKVAVGTAYSPSSNVWYTVEIQSKTLVAAGD